MKRIIIEKEVRKASVSEIEKILAFMVKENTKECIFEKHNLTEDEILEEYISNKKSLIYANRTFLKFNTGEKIILFDCFSLINAEFEDKRGNFLMLNHHFILQNGELQDIGDADVLFEE